MATLALLPYAGGSGAAYHALRARINGIECLTIDLPGRGSRSAEAPRETFAELVDDICEQLTCIAEYRQSVVFGYSMGGLLAYEAVRKLFFNARIAPSRLILAACDPPEAPRANDTADMTDRQFIHHLVSNDMMPKEIAANPEFAQYFGGIIRHDFRLLADYRPSPSIRIPVRAEVLYSDDESNVALWKRRFSLPVEFHKFSGGHFFLRSRTEELAARIESYWAIR